MKGATERSLQSQQPAGVFATLQPDEMTAQITFGRDRCCLVDGKRDRGAEKGREGSTLMSKDPLFFPLALVLLVFFSSLSFSSSGQQAGMKEV